LRVLYRSILGVFGVTVLGNSFIQTNLWRVKKAENLAKDAALGKG
jgi:hypothetical protein